MISYNLRKKIKGEKERHVECEKVQIYFGTDNFEK